MIEFELPGGHVSFSTRRGGVSEGPYESLNLGVLTDDDPDRVAENRRRVAVANGFDPGSMAGGLQVHGAEIHSWDAPRGAGDPPEADGHTTTAEGLALLVISADCLPVALVSPSRVAMLHCGWRGLAAGIVERGVDLFDDPPAAVIGPGIGPCCYEVGEEVSAHFADVPGASEAGRLDLVAVTRARLAAAGAGPVLDTGLCTSCRGELFFSHRRDGGLTGRQGGLVWRS